MYNNSVREVEKICAALAAQKEKYEGSYLEVLVAAVEREVTIAEVFSHFVIEDSYFKAMFWCPVDDEVELERRIREKAKKVENAPEITLKLALKKNELGFEPPSSLLTNELLSPFQEIVNTYAVPKYREINPAVFTAASFPVLFGIMFGDVGHGLILLIIGIILFRARASLERAGLGAAVAARWPLLLLGFFSTYTGFIYNDFMSLHFGIFKSCYKQGKLLEKGCVYPFGFDWVWGNSENEIPFYNSFKTKFSIIIGVLQMSFGIGLKGRFGVI